MLDFGMPTLRAEGRRGRSSGLSGALAFGLAAAISVCGAHANAAPQVGDPEGRLVKDMVKDAVVLEKAGKCKEALSLLRQAAGPFAAAIRQLVEIVVHGGRAAMGHDLLTDADVAGPSVTLAPRSAMILVPK